MSKVLTFQVPTLPPEIAIDHNYCVPFFPGPDDEHNFARGVISNIDDIIDGVVQVGNSQRLILFILTVYQM